MPERRSSDPILTNIFKSIEAVSAQIASIQEKQLNIYEEVINMKATIKAYEDKIEIIDKKLRDLPIHREGIETLLSYLIEKYESIRTMVKNFERVEELKQEGQKQVLSRIVIALFSGAGFIITVVITYLLSKGVKP